jgi:glycosyltransferase involved in cell wall biosynthesis
VRVLALLATYNERRFVEPCIEHLHAQGVETYLIDNCSTDGTVELAERHLGRGLIGVEELPRDECFDLRAQLRRKEQLAGELEADWFLHLDADEVRLPPLGWGSLADALARVGRDGYNAVNFLEFTFVPTREQPDHDHADYARTLRTYYPFAPSFPHKLTAWKAAASAEVELAPSGGHRLRFPGLRMSPESFPMKHYLFLSVAHATEKYVERNFDAEEVESGWHGWRASLTPVDITLPSESELRVAQSDEDLDPSDPRTRHHIDEQLRARMA